MEYDFHNNIFLLIQNPDQLYVINKFIYDFSRNFIEYSRFISLSYHIDWCIQKSQGGCFSKIQPEEFQEKLLNYVQNFKKILLYIYITMMAPFLYSLEPDSFLTVIGKYQTYPSYSSWRQNHKYEGVYLFSIGE